MLEDLINSEDGLDPEVQRLKIVSNFYKDVKFPYETTRKRIVLHQQMTVEEILGFIKSWSIVMKKMQKNGECVEFETFKKSVVETLDGEKKHVMDMPIEIILSRKIQK
jgi:hypothetical protein